MERVGRVVLPMSVYAIERPRRLLDSEAPAFANHLIKASCDDDVNRARGGTRRQRQTYGP